MKKIFLGFLTCASIGIIYAFSNIKYESNTQREWCVQVMKNGKKWGVTVMALNMSEAKETALRYYPDAKTVGNPTLGACK